MDDKADKPKRRWPTYLAIVLVLVIYPLSIGPARVITARVDSVASSDLFDAFYSPVYLFCEAIETFDLVDSYLRQWFRVTNTPIPYVELIAPDGTLNERSAF